MTPRNSDDVVAHWHREVSQAAATFERRWTLRALTRVDGDLAARMRDQRALFDQVTITGTPAEIQLHGAATVRGWNACVRALEAAAEPEDAFLEGFDASTGFRVAISHQRAAADRAAEIHGHKVVFVTPDEIAGILASLESFKAIAALKQHFPGAEILEFHPDEPAKSDAA